jgi:hypothetical protein
MVDAAFSCMSVSSRVAAHSASMAAAVPAVVDDLEYTYDIVKQKPVKRATRQAQIYDGQIVRANWQCTGDYYICTVTALFVNPFFCIG